MLFPRSVWNAISKAWNAFPHLAVAGGPRATNSARAQKTSGDCSRPQEQSWRRLAMLDSDQVRSTDGYTRFESVRLNQEIGAFSRDLHKRNRRVPLARCESSVGFRRERFGSLVLTGNRIPCCISATSSPKESSTASSVITAPSSPTRLPKSEWRSSASEIAFFSGKERGECSESHERQPSW